jgi:hypothetical protein
MIGETIRDIFQYKCPVSSSNYEISFKKMESRPLFFLPSRILTLNALLILKTDEIDFQSISNDIRRANESENDERRRKIRCNWLVCSDRGGIYLFEAIATKENKSRGNMKNRFIVLNTGDGTISFGPGHENNMRYTRRMQDLIAAYRSIPPEAWNAAFAKLVGELFAELR